jgi:hypothetical protein
VHQCLRQAHALAKALREGADFFAHHLAQAGLLDVLGGVAAGRGELAARLRGREGGVLAVRTGARFPAGARADNEAFSRYTILDIVATNALGLLYRISRVISQHGCDVDLVLIATEGEKAIDVFHITKGGSKLTEAEQQELTADLLRILEDTQ